MLACVTVGFDEDLGQTERIKRLIPETEAMTTRLLDLERVVAVLTREERWSWIWNCVDRAARTGRGQIVTDADTR